jgi:hypothetical protein
MLHLNKLKYILAILAFNLLFVKAIAKMYFVSTTESDVSTGTFTDPLKTIEKATIRISHGGNNWYATTILLIFLAMVLDNRWAIAASTISYLKQITNINE